MGQIAIPSQEFSLQNNEAAIAMNRLATPAQRKTSELAGRPSHPSRGELFPPLPPNEPRALGEDIKANGMRMPVTLLHQQSKSHYVLVDGVCRLDALEMVGLDATAPRRWMIGPPNVSLLGPGCLVTGSFRTHCGHRFDLQREHL